MTPRKILLVNTLSEERDFLGKWTQVLTLVLIFSTWLYLNYPFK